MRVKTSQDLVTEDCGPIIAQFSQEWALLADKGYQGLAQQLRSIRLTRAPSGCRLSADDERDNNKIFSDRVIVEKYLGG